MPYDIICMSAHKKFKVIFNIGYGGKPKLFNQYVFDGGGNKSGQGGAQMDILNP